MQDTVKQQSSGPGYDALTVTLMPVGSTSQRSVQELGFASIGLLTRCAASIRFLFVGPALCLQLLHLVLATDTLAVRLTLPLAGRVEDFHLQVSAPCRTHQNQRPPSLAALTLPIQSGLVVFVAGALPRHELANG